MGSSINMKVFSLTKCCVLSDLRNTLPTLVMYVNANGFRKQRLFAAERMNSSLPSVNRTACGKRRGGFLEVMKGLEIDLEHSCLMRNVEYHVYHDKCQVHIYSKNFDMDRAGAQQSDTMKYPARL